MCQIATSRACWTATIAFFGPPFAFSALAHGRDRIGFGQLCRGLSDIRLAGDDFGSEAGADGRGHRRRRFSFFTPTPNGARIFS